MIETAAGPIFGLLLIYGLCWLCGGSLGFDSHRDYARVTLKVWGTMMLIGFIGWIATS